MCDPLTIGGIGLTGLSSIAHMQGETERAGERDRVQRAERVRQRGFEQESQGLFDQALNRVDKTRQDADTKSAEDKRTGDVTRQLETTATPVDPSEATQPQDTSVVKSSNARELLKALNVGKTRAQRSAAVNAYGDNNLGVGFDLSRFGVRQVQLGNASQRSASLLPLELQEANTKGAGWDTLGTALGVGGQIAGTAGAFGKGPGWSDLFGGADDVSSSASVMYGSPRPDYGTSVRGGKFGLLRGGV